MSDLAILGGTPLFDEPLNAPQFPPRNPATAQRLGEVYMNGPWSFNGPEEQAFCAEFAASHGAKYGVFMANGTVTLQAALTALGLGPGDEVIVPALTWPATALAVHYVGATPVFADVERETLCLDPDCVEAAITPRTRAIIPVHLYGGCADLDRLLAICEQHDLGLVEDCAHGQGGKWRGRGLGSWGDVGSFSFQESKTMAAGEGGICLTNDAALAERLYRIKHIGYPPNSGQGKARTGPPVGMTCHNFRATEFQCVILRDQLTDLDARIARYNRAADRISTALADIPGVERQATGRQATAQSYYAYMLRLDPTVFADAPSTLVLEALRAEGLSACGTYGPVIHHLMWNLTPEQYRIAHPCPIGETYATTNVIGLPHPWLDADDATIDNVIAVLTKVLSQPDAIRQAAAAAQAATV